MVTTEGSSRQPGTRSPGVGRRIQVIGNSCSGKSTVAGRLATALGVPRVEIDALNWLPDWVGLNATDPAELERRLNEATRGDGFVVDGFYMGFCRRTFWPRLTAVVWLDLPLAILVGRVLVRSVRRWRTRELLWGQNREAFWPVLKVWQEESLLTWIVSRHAKKRRSMNAWRADPRWAHLRFVHLTSSRRIEAFLRAVEGRTSTTGCRRLGA